MKEILKGPVLIHYLVTKLKEKNPYKQVGKTIIQKLMYIFETCSNEDFDYTIYHYGPFSYKVDDYISMAEALNLLQIEWVPNKGYFINSLNEPSDLLMEVEEEKKRQMEKVVEKFGSFSANELSIIATALYVKNNFNICESSKIVDSVLSLKPNHQRDWVKQLLKKAGIIDESH